ncbi:hypothetical protein EVAR_69449_1 [Eumeta japonica]|uniref:Uncharacterized protein n=1 Tax=Eumeta variegata TaxID=151549 RepID=A0A4C1SEC3_EUMVA|nr:hypothetical protein EVAR_69449_1 [Eumeta japonica]
MDEDRPTKETHGAIVRDKRVGVGGRLPPYYGARPAPVAPGHRAPALSDTSNQACNREKTIRTVIASRERLSSTPSASGPSAGAGN